MAVAIEPTLIERSKRLIGVLRAACMVAELLSEKGTAEVSWRTSCGQKCGKREIGTGDEDEGFEEILEEIKSLMHTWGDSLQTGDLEITIS